MTADLATLGLAIDSRPVVTAVGALDGMPDLAVVRFGVQAQAKDAKRAQTDVNALMQKIIAAVKGRGIPAERITTERIELQPVYEQREPKPGEAWEQPRLAGYRAANVVRVELPVQGGKGDKVGDVIDAAVGAGANTIEGISFELRNDAEARTKALQQAAQEARRKAEALASALGMQLGNLIVASESQIAVTPPVPMYAMEAKRFAGAPVQPGELVIRASVTVRYGFR